VFVTDKVLSCASAGDIIGVYCDMGKKNGDCQVPPALSLPSVRFLSLSLSLAPAVSRSWAEIGAWAQVLKCAGVVLQQTQQCDATGIAGESEDHASDTRQQGLLRCVWRACVRGRDAREVAD
jgi:hypothetical protein